jgi:hypothetical protein
MENSHGTHNSFQPRFSTCIWAGKGNDYQILLFMISDHFHGFQYDYFLVGNILIGTMVPLTAYLLHTGFLLGTLFDLEDRLHCVVLRWQDFQLDN